MNIELKHVLFSFSAFPDTFIPFFHGVTYLRKP